jgi:site-specific recombinase XerD
MDDANSTALVPVESGGEVALPEDLVARATDYMERSRAETTRASYAWWAGRFEAWCQKHGVAALPASPETVAAWVTDLADNGTGPYLAWSGRGENKRQIEKPSRALSRSSIGIAVAAVQAMHRDNDYELNRKSRVLAQVMAGIARSKPASTRKAEPFVIRDMLELLDSINTDMKRGARDACLVTLGFGAALRRSELVGLDWQQLGTGTGFVCVKPEGILVVLTRSKASQDRPVEVMVPRAHLPEASRALEHWAEVAKLKPGEPILRSVTNGHVISDERLQAASVARIIKDLVADLAIHRSGGKLTRKEALAMAAGYSGHSVRRGVATSMAAAGADVLRMAKVTRHKSISVLQEYVDQVEGWGDGSGLKGIRGGKQEAA